MNRISNILKEKYGVNATNIQEMPGGWLNKKYLIEDENGNKYNFKIFSTKKVEKMSKGEFSSDYLDVQIKNNLAIENYMQKSGLKCPKVATTLNNELLIDYDQDRASLIEYVEGNNISRDEISNDQLHNLGKECAIMHNLFERVDSKVYTGKYLKMPTLDDLWKKLSENVDKLSGNEASEYLEMLNREKEILKYIEQKEVVKDIPIGVVHGDFADDNIIFNGNQPYIIDFELARKNSFLQDIGRIITSFCFEDNRLNNDKVNSLIYGYKKEKNLEANDVALSLIVVWLNEFNIWIKPNYFNKEITQKAKRFQDELIFITNNFFDIMDVYYNNKDLRNTSLCNRK